MRLIARMAVTARSGTLLSLMLLGVFSTQARAQVHVNINIGPPAPVIVEAPPQMLFLPDPGVYVAVGIPYDVFFISGHYYYFHATIFMAITGSGDRVTADLGLMSNIEACLLGSKGTRLSSCVNTASGSTGSTEIKGGISVVNTFTQPPDITTEMATEMATETTMAVMGTALGTAMAMAEVTTAKANTSTAAK